MALRFPHGGDRRLPSVSGPQHRNVELDAHIVGVYYQRMEAGRFLPTESTPLMYAVTGRGVFPP